MLQGSTTLYCLSGSGLNEQLQSDLMPEQVNMAAIHTHKDRPFRIGETIQCLSKPALDVSPGCTAQILHPKVSLLVFWKL